MVTEADACLMNNRAVSSQAGLTCPRRQAIDECAGRNDGHPGAAHRVRQALDDRLQVVGFLNSWIELFGMGNDCLAWGQRILDTDGLRNMSEHRRAPLGGSVDDGTLTMEVTPETETAVKRLLDAGWVVTNQLVFTAAASRRGHTARLRETLNDAGILTYYTFTVKGYMENNHNFAPNARAVQEQLEEMSRLERLKRFLSPDMAELIVSSGDDSRLQSHRSEIAVIFCDLRGFTNFSDSV